MPRTRKADRKFRWIPLNEQVEVQEYLDDNADLFATVEEAQQDLEDNIDYNSAGSDYVIVEVKKYVHICQPTTVSVKDGKCKKCGDCDC